MFVPDHADSSDVIIVRVFFSIDKDVKLQQSTDIDAAGLYKGGSSILSFKTDPKSHVPASKPIILPQFQAIAE
jgi:hypothetical protein